MDTGLIWTVRIQYADLVILYFYQVAAVVIAHRDCVVRFSQQIQAINCDAILHNFHLCGCRWAQGPQTSDDADEQKKGCNGRKGRLRLRGKNVHLPSFLTRAQGETAGQTFCDADCSIVGQENHLKILPFTP